MIMRFEILDIISQDATGVVFQATDQDSQRLVALMRFFPFGVEGGGLTEEEQEGYTAAVAGLIGVNHPSLRQVVAGGCDPVDGMPFLATEWVEGLPLSKRIAEGPLRGSDALRLMTDLVDVSLYLSARFGSEVVWVATDLERIVMIYDGELPRFTFSISPAKWLMAEEKRGIEPLIGLTEAVMGWQGQVVGDQAGEGLGAWLKWLRRSAADATLEDARSWLAGMAGNEAGPTLAPETAPELASTRDDEPQPQPSTRAPRRDQAPVLKEPSSRGAWILVVLLGIVVAAVAGWVWQRKQEPPQVVAAEKVASKTRKTVRAIPPRKILVVLENPGFELPGRGTKITNGFAEVPGWQPNGDHYADSGVEKNALVGTQEGEWIAYLQSKDDGVFQITDHVIASGDAIALTWLAGPTSESGLGKPHLVRLFRTTAENERHEMAVSLETVGQRANVLERHVLTYQTTKEDVGQRIGVEFEVPADGTDRNAFIGFDDFKLSVTTKASLNFLAPAADVSDAAFRVEDAAQIAELVGQVIDLQGECRAVWRSTSGKSVYLGFSKEPSKEDLCGFIPAKLIANAKPGFESQYLNQNLLITGKVVVRNQRTMVEATAIEHVKVIDDGVNR